MKRAEPFHCSEVRRYPEPFIIGKYGMTTSTSTGGLPFTMVLPVVGVKPMSQGESGLSAHVVNFCPALKDLGISVSR